MAKGSGNVGNYKPAVEKDIPMPRPFKRQRMGVENGLPTGRFHHNHTPGLRVTYPFDEMEVGDSFFVPGGGKMPIYVSASKYRNDPERDNLRKKFAIRQWHDGEKYGYRMWRTA